MAGLLAAQGNVEALRRRGETGDGCAAEALIRLLVERGDVTEPRRQAGSGNRYAALRLVDVLTANSDLAQLRELAERAGLSHGDVVQAAGTSTV